MSKTVMHKSQEDLILGHLKVAGSITGVEAAAIFKVRSLSRRICTIKAMGIQIISIHMTDSQGQRYVRYHLAKAQPRWFQMELNIAA